MGQPWVVAVSAVILIALVVSEFVLNRKRGLKLYTVDDVLSHVTVGLGQTFVNALTFGAVLAAYSFVHSHFAIFKLDPKNAWHWVLVVFALDVTFYWAHRAGHRVNLFAAVHGVHHQPEDFSHISALRQSWFNRPFMSLFYLPLAVVGFPVEMAAGALSLNLVAMFWSHNGVMTGDFGWFGKIFVTPRSHKIHHGAHDPYLDKNFGGIFIFWDRLFGSYAELDPKVPLRIGSGWRINHRDAAQAHLDYYRRIVFAAKHREGWFAKAAVWFGKPEVLDAELREHGYDEVLYLPVATSRPSTGATIAALLAVAAMVGVFAAKGALLPLPARILAAGIVFFLMVRMNRMVSDLAESRAGNVAEAVPEKSAPISVMNIRYDNSKEVEFQTALKRRVDAWFKENHGGNRKATPFMWAKIIFVLSTFVWNWYELAFKTHSMPGLVAHLALAAVLFMTIAYSIAHDAVHNAISGNRKIDSIIYFFTFNLLGANSYLWKYRHNDAHHAIVNIPGWDLDIEGSKLIRFAPHVKWMPVHRFQHLYTSFLYMLFTMQWILMKDFQIFAMKEIGRSGKLKHSKWRLAEIIALKLFYFGYTIAIPAMMLPYSLGQVVTTFVLFHFAFSYVLTLSFVYSHVGVNTKFVYPDSTGKLPHSYAKHQLLTSVDFHAQNRWVGFIYGGFNAHAAHHIFPGLSSIHYWGVSKILKETSEEFGMPYHEVPLPQMVASHYRFLKKMGSGPDGGAEHVIYSDAHPAPVRTVAGGKPRAKKARKASA
ncbi:MAG: fatty acid desaturase [Bdellovibrionales bacterium]|nr:fatty acid desaturase [Bdellovibrionales bacterium]